MHSSLLDFIYIDEFRDSIESENSYLAKESLKNLKSNEALFNLGVLHYRDREYPEAIESFSKIRSDRADFKAKVFYNIANLYVKIGDFPKAENFYLKSLLLKYDEDSDYNRELILELMRERAKRIKELEAKKKRLAKSQNSKNSQDNSSNSKGKSNMSTAGESGSSKSKFESATTLSLEENKRVLSFKQYSQINRGSLDEEKPW